MSPGPTPPLRTNGNQPQTYLESNIDTPPHRSWQPDLPYLADLFGPEVGWHLAPILTWIVGGGRPITEPRAFVRRLCEKLIETGAPLWRFGVDVRTIHPRFAAWELTWKRQTRRVVERTAAHGIRDTFDYVGTPTQMVHQTRAPVRRRLVSLDPEFDHPSLHLLAARGGTDYVAMPLVFSDDQVNVLVLATDGENGFSDVDLAKFEVLTAFLAGSFEIFSAHRSALALLDTYVGPRAGRQVLQGLVHRGKGQLIDAAIWLSDLRSFTQLSESLPAEKLLRMLNAYFEFINAAVTAQGGEILLFIGDAALVVFPTGPDGDRRQACKAALEAARDATFGIATVNMRRVRAGEPEIKFAVGLDVGEVVYGNVGAPDRLNFTVMGPTVNRAARLETLTRELGHSVLASVDFAASMDEPLVSLGHYTLKGLKEPQEIFTPQGF